MATSHFGEKKVKFENHHEILDGTASLKRYHMGMLKIHKVFCLKKINYFGLTHSTLQIPKTYADNKTTQYREAEFLVIGRKPKLEIKF